MDISAEYKVGRGKSDPVEIVVESILFGVQHVDVQISGCTIFGIVERNTVDPPRPANLLRRIYLLRYGKIREYVRRQLVLGEVAFADLYVSAGIECVETHHGAPRACAVVTAVRSHFYEIGRVRGQICECVGI